MDSALSLTAELTQLLSNLSSDFSTDGLISNGALIVTLLSNISQLNLTDIRDNVEDKYSNLGQTFTIPEEAPVTIAFFVIIILVCFMRNFS